ncbi:YfgM family protein [Catenovulum maritimum]|uniref:Ancillary SecYEG translocon subunit n=1 Tax=Catenovulum maritimum TaxID=1513271 RepID=A0A0J8GVT4_9ALTE|nr:tetratricopeptide repeat protein [Catenovulum maritimum]KMT64788.1 hypothetical protein XM47_13090 [Catenovulum maritimum]
MEIYSTEEQQVEAIKSFWAKYGNAAIGGVIIGLASIYGFNAYQDSQLETQEANSNAYVAASESNEASKLASYVESNKDSGYATLAALKLAKIYVEQDDLAQAKTQLKWVAANAADSSLVDLANLRLARILVSEANLDEALSLVQVSKTEAFTAQFAELVGDIQLAKEDSSAARIAYQKAADNGGLTSNPGLKMKLDNLAVDNGIVAVLP